MLNKLFLFFYTVRYMTGKQIYCLFIKRIVKVNNHSYDGEYLDVNSLIPGSDFIPKDISCDINEFRFLNDSVEFNIYNIDWRASDQPKLWRYNLHYFDYLNADCYNQETKNLLITSWIENNPVGEEDAWCFFTVRPFDSGKAAQFVKSSELF